MKIGLIVVCVIVGLLLILLLLPLTIDFKFDNVVNFKIKYSGIILFDNEKKVNLNKRQKRKKEDENTDCKASKKENFLIKTYKQKGLLGTINYFSDIGLILLKRLRWILKHIKFRRFMLTLQVATADAADTAIQYGKICAAVYPVISFLQSCTDFKFKEININAVFDRKKPEFKTSILLKINAFYCIVAAICVLIQFYKLQRKESEKYERKQSEDRNGHHNGQASHDD